MNLPADADFASVVRHLFDHPYEDPAWHWDADADYWPAAPVRAAEFLGRLFRDSGRLLAPYSDDQVGQGLNYISSPSCSDYGHCAIDDEVPLTARLELIAGIAELYRQVYAHRLPPLLGHLDETRGALALSCYMWWDVFPWYLEPEDPGRREVDERMLTTLEEVLALHSAPCQEAALHGLAHSAYPPPARVREIIDRFLASGAVARPELVTYAKRARQGHVQ
jgi:hypothetical protein